MSTFKRPVLLKAQLESILKQSFKNFEVVISDNDPEGSAEDVVKIIGDKRLKYFPNKVNLGMMKSFNKSIERSQSNYIIMITDDDPVVPEMLDKFYQVVNKYPDVGIYCGCSRSGKSAEQVEHFNKSDFSFQILNPRLTTNLLWSSCIIRKSILLEIGSVPDYGSPHLADHAMIALCGNKAGGVLINKMYSELTAHENNFSKTNIALYYVACNEFYKLINKSVEKKYYFKNGENALIKHLERWFITYSFSLRKFYTYQNKDQTKITEVNIESKKILDLKYMSGVKLKYLLKLTVFKLKRPLIVLGVMN
ncbi:MAG: glycosyltransferase family 2 protein [Ferruginibacter sp.]